MATQPAPRPFEESNMFPHNQSARPLVYGVVHRNQPLSDDPLVTWLTAQGKAPKQTANFAAWVAEQQRTAVTENGKPDGKPLLGSDGKPVMRLTADAAKELLAQSLQPGSPTDPDNFVKTVPFAMSEADLKRGQVLYTAICAECHGGAGWGNGKIPERGFLRPPSYHMDPKYTADELAWAADPKNKDAKFWQTRLADGWKTYEKDWSRNVVKDGVAVKDATKEDPQNSSVIPFNASGTSRGFYKYGVQIPLKDVPVGYIYQVIYWGFGGMASHETQVPDAADRWRLAAFVRVLQHSQAADASKLPADITKELNAEKSEKKPAQGEGHK